MAMTFPAHVVIPRQLIPQAVGQTQDPLLAMTTDFRYRHPCGAHVQHSLLDRVEPIGPEDGFQQTLMTVNQRRVKTRRLTRPSTNVGSDDGRRAACE
jgi:hypothetical protein